MLLRKLSINRLTVCFFSLPFPFHLLTKHPLCLQLSDFIADDAAEALLQAHINPERRALYKDVDWKSAKDLIEESKGRLIHGEPVIWLWSTPCISSLSLGQQGALIRDLCRSAKKEVRSFSNSSRTSLLIPSSLTPSGSRCPDLKALNDGSIDNLCFLSFANVALYRKVWKENRSVDFGSLLLVHTLTLSFPCKVMESLATTTVSKVVSRMVTTSVRSRLQLGSTMEATASRRTLGPGSAGPRTSRMEEQRCRGIPSDACWLKGARSVPGQAALLALAWACVDFFTAVRLSLFLFLFQSLFCACLWDYPTEVGHPWEIEYQ